MATQKQIEAAANAIVNEVAAHMGSPPVTNALAMLKPANQERVLAQARAALEAAARVGGGNQ